MANQKRQRQDTLRAEKLARQEAEKQAAVKKKKTKRFMVIGGILAALVIGLTVYTSRGGDSDGPATVSLGKAPVITIPAGAPPKATVSKDLKVGTGAVVKVGDTVTVKYTGMSWSTKEEFDSNWDSPDAFPVPDVGTDAAGVIPGWKKIVGMKVGGRRQIIITPKDGYGTKGSPPKIKPNETLVFVIDVISTDTPTK